MQKGCGLTAAMHRKLWSVGATEPDIDVRARWRIAQNRRKQASVRSVVPVAAAFANSKNMVLIICRILAGRVGFEPIFDFFGTGSLHQKPQQKL